MPFYFSQLHRDVFFAAYTKEALSVTLCLFGNSQGRAHLNTYVRTS